MRASTRERTWRIRFSLSFSLSPFFSFHPPRARPLTPTPLLHQTQSQSRADSFLSSLEAKYAPKPKKGKGAAAKKKKGGEEEDPMDDAMFEKMRQRVGKK